MRKLLYAIAVSMVAFSLAMCVGCSPSASGSAAGASGDASSGAASAPEPVDPANLTNGEYAIDVTLQGGSGKATVESPAKLIVSDGEMKAVIVWSSPNYDQMIVDGKQYLPVPRDGNSTFEIPVSAFDVDLPIQAETTAMSEPHMIDYTLHFDSSTITR